MDPNGKVALITGGARIGRAVALALAERGCRVILTHRTSRGSAEDTRRDIQARGGAAWTLKAHLAQPGAADRLIDAVERRWKRLDVLVNMASLYEETPVSTLRPAARGARALDRAAAVDLRAAALLALRAARLMKKSGGGRIVNFSDWVAASGRPRYKNFLPYYVAKAGVKGLTEALALELAPDVLVNAVAPGPILPPAGLSRAADREVRAATPLGRWGGPDEIAKAVLFLVDTDFVTGETLRVDGGRHLS